MSKTINVKTVNKVPGEKETRAKIMMLARSQGLEDQVKKIFAKYEDALKGAKDEFAYHHISSCGIAEIHVLLGCEGPLVVNGREILPGKPGWEEKANLQKGIVALD